MSDKETEYMELAGYIALNYLYISDRRLINDGLEFSRLARYMPRFKALALELGHIPKEDVDEGQGEESK